MIVAPRTARRTFRSWLLPACLLFLGALVSLPALYMYLRSTHRPLTQSGPARSISKGQAQLLLSDLGKRPAYSLTIKTDPSDHEAEQFAQQIHDSLRESRWHVVLSTDSTGPAVGPGLTIAQTGEDARPSYPNHSEDPYFFLPNAFAAAHVDIAAETGQSSGDYKLYLVVGHREQIQPAPSHGYILRAAVRWLLRHLKHLRKA